MDSKLISYLALIVLTAGIVSCSKDSGGTASSGGYAKPSSPRLVSKNKDSLPLQKLSISEFVQWDLSDQLVFDDLGTFKRLSVESRCELGGEVFIQVNQMELKKVISLFELVSEKLLFKPLNNNLAVCNLRISVYSDQSDIHSYPDIQLKLAETQTAGIHLTNHNGETSTEISFYSLAQLSSLQIHPQSQVEKMIFSCEGVSFESRLSPNAIRTLADFDLTGTHTNEKTRLCRIVSVSENGLPVELSPTFGVNFDSLILKPMVTFTSRTDVPISSNSLITDPLAGFPIGEVTITNSAEHPLWVTLPESLSVTGQAGVLVQPGPTFNCLEFSNEISAGLKANLSGQPNGKGEIVFRMESGQTLSVSYVLVYTERVRTGSISLPLKINPLTDLKIEFAQNFQPRDTTEIPMIIDTQTIELPQELYFVDSSNSFGLNDVREFDRRCN